ncbi:hypothetical protein M5D96_011619 [Drosophila gunungcola]|uniref:Uncharacterized protein n=1 Tax=Drosophila gunungcola TaxID=103775 RepID=A0A9Q0BL34_9MUSC|nr:hypothetical protein M5D96_011619 [Drosophila gunungcola]
MSLRSSVEKTPTTAAVKHQQQQQQNNNKTTTTTARAHHRRNCSRSTKAEVAQFQAFVLPILERLIHSLLGSHKVRDITIGNRYREEYCEYEYNYKYPGAGTGTGPGPGSIVFALLLVFILHRYHSSSASPAPILRPGAEAPIVAIPGEAPSTSTSTSAPTPGQLLAHNDILGTVIALGCRWICLLGPRPLLLLLGGCLFALLHQCQGQYHSVGNTENAPNNTI